MPAVSWPGLCRVDAARSARRRYLQVRGPVPTDSAEHCTRPPLRLLRACTANLALKPSELRLLCMVHPPLFCPSVLPTLGTATRAKWPARPARPSGARSSAATPRRPCASSASLSASRRNAPHPRACAIPLPGQCAPPARSAALARRQGHAAVASARVESIRCAAARRRALRDRGVRRGERVRR